MWQLQWGVGRQQHELLVHNLELGGESHQCGGGSSRAHPEVSVGDVHSGEARQPMWSQQHVAHVVGEPGPVVCVM